MKTLNLNQLIGTERASMQAKTIGIIGAGVSGLVTAKTMREHGFDVV